MSIITTALLIGFVIGCGTGALAVVFVVLWAITRAHTRDDLVGCE